MIKENFIKLYETVFVRIGICPVTPIMEKIPNIRMVR